MCVFLNSFFICYLNKGILVNSQQTNGNNLTVLVSSIEMTTNLGKLRLITQKKIFLSFKRKLANHMNHLDNLPLKLNMMS